MWQGRASLSEDGGSTPYEIRTSGVAEATSPRVRERSARDSGRVASLSVGNELLRLRLAKPPPHPDPLPARGEREQVTASPPAHLLL
jgi:hypothetical protein